jgi:hypothetical protein
VLQFVHCYTTRSSSSSATSSSCSHYLHRSSTHPSPYSGPNGTPRQHAAAKQHRSSASGQTTHTYPSKARKQLRQCTRQPPAIKGLSTNSTLLPLHLLLLMISCSRGSSGPRRRAVTMMPVSTPKVLVRPVGQRQYEWVDLWESYVSGLAARFCRMSGAWAGSSSISAAW